MNYVKYVHFCWGLLCSAAAPMCDGEMYTSLLNVKQVIDVERRLMGFLRTYIDQELERLEDIKRFYAKVSDLHNEVYNGPATALANPLVAFTLIKRLQSEWLNVVYSDEAMESIQALRSSYEEVESSLPKLEDLKGAAKGLMRLQDVYALQVKSLVMGRFQRVTNGNPIDIYMPTVSIPLSGDDCFLVGKVAYEQGDYYHSVQWFAESVRLFRGTGSGWSPEHEGTLEDALDHLAFSHFKTGNVSYALSLSQELLHRDPMNGRVLQNIEKYEKLLVNSPPLLIHDGGLKRPNSTYLRTRNAYERLCQTQGTQPKNYENPRLFCDYFTNGGPGLLLQPIRREVLSLQPYVVLYHHFVTDNEAETVKVFSQPGLRRSVVASGEKQETADYRISKSAWLKASAHRIIGQLDQRISMVTGLNVHPPYGEHLQVVNYGIGGHYEPHFDHATSTSSPLFKLKTGNRVATFMIYLSSVEAGGSTAFIYANFSVPVVKLSAALKTPEGQMMRVSAMRFIMKLEQMCKVRTKDVPGLIQELQDRVNKTLSENAALFWWNLHKNGEGDGDTLHAGCPVLAGDKWVANKWIHEYGQEFQRRCSLNPEE